MVRKIIWSKKAEIDFQQTLDFFAVLNGNKTYSKNLSKEVKSILTIIVKNPFIGINFDNETRRVFIFGDYKIFYEVQPMSIKVLLVWNTRRNPEKITI